ncbi:hypothetical protein Q4457_05170 [Clostridium perfringens]|uniref:hypothetical protein n=1 Tax=Clostridium perfringens TaxID=1502 RepID=UPI0026E1E1BA|nr:hypothetical protein [Clostridium perfringens]MDO6336443.1 hypothetical protein [Clostridium perfringens]
MMVNLSELAVLKGITINRVLRILAFIGVVADVEFKLFNTKTPLIEESKIQDVDFINTVIPKSEKVRLDVLMDIYKERVEVEKKKEKILKEIFKSLNVCEKKFDEIDIFTVEEVVELSEKLFKENLDKYGLKCRIFEEILLVRDNEKISEYLDKLTNEKNRAKEERQAIKEEMGIEEVETIQNEIKVDRETGEIIEEQQDSDLDMTIKDVKVREWLRDVGGEGKRFKDAMEKIKWECDKHDETAQQRIDFQKEAYGEVVGAYCPFTPKPIVTVDNNIYDATDISFLDDNLDSTLYCLSLFAEEIILAEKETGWNDFGNFRIENNKLVGTGTRKEAYNLLAKNGYIFDREIIEKYNGQIPHFEEDSKGFGKMFKF